ncbi:MAG: ABC transporter ATP-binding protein [Fimbriimonadaceae bacterium]|nr:ABC transporter ATP-binding protein [Fimbriimonadaceae bacterium]
MTPTVQLSAIDKRFGAVQALQGVDLDVEHGRIHALVGENGAGKTTLMRVLYGSIRPDGGTLRLDGQERRFRSSAEAIAAGVGMVSQHYSVIPELTCLENLVLGAEPGAVIHVAGATERAKELAERMGFEFDWRAEAATLTPAGAQKLEILKLLWRNSRIMILDEPTAMLSPSDADALYESLRRLADEGATVIVVTHRIPEVILYCDHVTVLRGGVRVADTSVPETDPTALAELIVGHPVGTDPMGKPLQGGKPLLVVRDLVVRGERGDEALKGVSLDVAEGEVLGIAGVDGSGQRELFQALFGLRSIERGSVRLGDADLEGWSTSRRLGAGLAIVPEDRHDEAVIESWSLEDNALLGHQRRPRFRRGAWVVRGEQHAFALAVADRFSTKHGGLRHPMSSLSGGNQQRFVAARALAEDPRVLLAFQPARGLDIAGAQRVYEAIRAECTKGGCALVVSFDLDELLQFCDRVVAMYHGTLTDPPRGHELDRRLIGRLMVGAKA